MMAEDESDAASTVAGDAVDAENSNGSKDNTNFRLLHALPPEIQRTALWPFLSPRDKMRFSGTCKSFHSSLAFERSVLSSCHAALTALGDESGALPPPPPPVRRALLPGQHVAVLFNSEAATTAPRGAQAFPLADPPTFTQLALLSICPALRRRQKSRGSNNGVMAAAPAGSAFTNSIGDGAATLSSLDHQEAIAATASGSNAADNNSAWALPRVLVHVLRDESGSSDTGDTNGGYDNNAWARPLLRHLQETALSLPPKEMGLLQWNAAFLEYAPAHGRQDPNMPAVPVFAVRLMVIVKSAFLYRLGRSGMERVDVEDVEGELVRLFESVGLPVTEADLLAMEELIRENVQRHLERARAELAARERDLLKLESVLRQVPCGECSSGKTRTPETKRRREVE